MVRLRKVAVCAPVLLLNGLLLAGCGSVFPHHREVPPPPPPPPVGYQIAPSGAVVASPGAKPAGALLQGPAAVRVAASHRQYFDQRRRRYYYYDPSRRAYFWEDGTPKT